MWIRNPIPLLSDYKSERAGLLGKVESTKSTNLEGIASIYTIQQKKVPHFLVKILLLPLSLS